MRLRDFALLFATCIVWGMNFVVTKWIVAGDGEAGGFLGLPPLFAVSLRFAIAALALAPLLRPVPRDMGRVALIAIVFGAAHFGLIHIGFVTATPSAGAIAIQLVVPFTAILSVLLLRERVGPARTLGIALSFVGVAIIAFDPEQAKLSVGVLIIALAAACSAWGSVLVKQIEPIGALRLQAWILLISTFPLVALSLAFEDGQVEALSTGGWRLAAAMAFVAGLVTIFAHTSYMWLLRRYEASFVAPLTLMGPIWGVIFGVTLTGDRVTAQFFLGAALTLVGVAIVAGRIGRRAAVMAAAPDPKEPAPAAERP